MLTKPAHVIYGVIWNKYETTVTDRLSADATNNSTGDDIGDAVTNCAGAIKQGDADRDCDTDGSSGVVQIRFRRESASVSRLNPRKRLKTRRNT